MKDIKITVTKKVASIEGTPIIVCGNSDYTLSFTFDDEWSNEQNKVARFSFTKNGLKSFIDVPVHDNTCQVPVLIGIGLVRVGVYAGDLKTTTGAKIKCHKSILCDDADTMDEPFENLYEELKEEIKEIKNNTGGGSSGGDELITAERIADDTITIDKVETEFFDKGLNFTEVGDIDFVVHQMLPLKQLNIEAYLKNKATEITQDATDEAIPTAKAVYDLYKEFNSSGGSAEIPENVETTDNKVKTIDENSTDEQYPSAKAVYDFVSENQGGSNTGMVVAIDYDKTVKAVAHRGYSTIAPENTLVAYQLAKQIGFNYAECDVAFTSDNVAVLLHDSTIDRTSDGSGNVTALTYEQLLQYDFGLWKSSKYTGTKIPTFEEFIKLCKNIGLHPYIELKDGGNYTQAQIQSIVDMVKKCGMQGNVTYISFNINFLNYVKAYDTKARLGYLADINTTTITTANGLKTEENEVFMDVYYKYITDEKVQMCIENNLQLEVWTVNEQTEIENMNSYITGVTSDYLIAGKVLYKKNIGLVSENDDSGNGDDSGGNGGGDIDDGYTVVKTLGSNDIMFGYGITDKAPNYYSEYPIRAIYGNFDIPVEYGYTYKFKAISNIPTAQMGCRFYSESVLNTVQGGVNNIAYGDYFDPGWQELTTEIEIPQFINNSPTACVRLSFRMDTTDKTNVIDGFIESVIISRKPVQNL